MTSASGQGAARRPLDGGSGDADLRSRTVPERGNVLDALRAIDAGRVAIALVLDDGDRLVGIITDGDVRRALPRGATLDASLSVCVQRNFTAVGPRVGRAEVLDLMQARRLEHVPVVDDHQRLIGLHLLHEVIQSEPRPNVAVIMAGGRGTRLAPLTRDVPKPMLTVAGRPILERLVLHLVGHGIRRIFLAINYLGDVIESHFTDGARFGCNVDYLRESAPLGTAGALSLLPTLTDPALVMNGDLVTQADIASILDFHASSRATATIGVRRYVHNIPFGCVVLEGDRVLKMDEKPGVVRLVNAGIYVLSPEAISCVPACKETTMPDLLTALLTDRLDVRAFEIEADWIDVGQTEELARARAGA